MLSLSRAVLTFTEWSAAENARHRWVEKALVLSNSHVVLAYRYYMLQCSSTGRVVRLLQRMRVIAVLLVHVSTKRKSLSSTSTNRHCTIITACVSFTFTSTCTCTSLEVLHVHVPASRYSCGVCGREKQLMVRGLDDAGAVSPACQENERRGACQDRRKHSQPPPPALTDERDSSIGIQPNKVTRQRYL